MFVPVVMSGKKEGVRRGVCHRTGNSCAPPEPSPLPPCHRLGQETRCLTWNSPSGGDGDEGREDGGDVRDGEIGGERDLLHDEERESAKRQQTTKRGRG